MHLTAPSGQPPIDVSAADLIVQFKAAAGDKHALLQIDETSGIDVVAPNEVAITLTEAQTAKLRPPSVRFALARRDGGWRDISATIIWPVVVGHTTKVDP